MVKKIALGFLMSLLLVSFVFAASVTRSVITDPISTSSPFIVRYTVTGASGKWATSVEETVSGGCTPSLKKFVIASESLPGDGECTSPCDITYTARSTAGTCTLASTSDYKFGDETAVAFGTSLQVTVGVTTCPTLGDTSSPCDGKVSNQELLNYISRWVNDEVNNQNLLDVISNWVIS